MNPQMEKALQHEMSLLVRPVCLQLSGSACTASVADVHLHSHQQLPHPLLSVHSVK